MNRVRRGASAALALLVAGCSRGHGTADAAAPGLSAEQKSRIHEVTVAPTSFRPTVEITGTVAFDGDRSTQVLASISGPVARILVDVGTHVEAGQALALVSSPDFAADLSAYRRAETAYINAERNAVRDSALFANDALARRELEQAQTDAAGAAADRDAALDALRALGADSATLADIRAGRPVASRQGVVRAPINGTVVEKLLNPGQLLQSGSTPCFTIADMSTVWVMGNLFETDLGRVSVGDSADIRPAVQDRVFRGTVTYIGALVSTDTRATAIRIVTPNPGGFLKRDMYVSIAVQSRHPRQGILVPASAVLRDAENLPFVFAIGPEGTYVRHLVTLGSHVGDQFEIVNGVSAGDRVVADGALYLQFAESQ